MRTGATRGPSAVPHGTNRICSNAILSGAAAELLGDGGSEGALTDGTAFARIFPGTMWDPASMVSAGIVVWRR